jgi:sucrose-phosphate synthase
VKDQGLSLLMISVHGLIRGQAPELGRDPDTGGQVLYVLELARALARHPEVAQVDLLTRLVEDPSVAADYACPEESLGPHARIIRMPFGPRRYIRKELLWDHLDNLVDGYLAHLRRQRRLPDLIHSHYADAGYVAQRLSSLLDIPFIHSGHSLGRCKRASLLQAGGSEAALERVFHFSRRIAAEEEVLVSAAQIITSTRQEAVDQYGLYANFDVRGSTVIPPGTDTSRFTPAGRRWQCPELEAKLDRFLADPRKPMLLCLGRAAPRKNLQGLLTAFGQDQELREKANLVLLAGNRDDLEDLEEASRETWKELLLTLDRHDLYGQVAIPKSHLPAEVPDFYRLAVRSRGLCINPSHSETFGLTLIEAAACGLPLVATHSGGPRDIIANCRNGLLVDVSDPTALAGGIKSALTDSRRWSAWSRNGIRGVRAFYTWEAHIARYLKLVKRILRRERKAARKEKVHGSQGGMSPFLFADKALLFDLDRALVGDPESLDALMAWLSTVRDRFAFGVTTGRRLESALWLLRKWGVAPPDVLISDVGSAIHYGPHWRPDAGWLSHIRRAWRREDLARALEPVPGLRLQAARQQGICKLSFHVNPNRFPGVDALKGLLHREGLRASLVYSQFRHLDVLPYRASKGQAIRYLAFKWGFPINHFVVAGDSGNDLDMLTGGMRAIVVANFSAEIEGLRDRAGIYFAGQAMAGGILEGLEHFGVLAAPAAASQAI